MKKLAQTITLLLLVAIVNTSCNPEKIEAESRSYQFTVQRNNSPLASATLSVATQSQNFTTASDNSGKCQISIPNDISLPNYTIVTVDHSSIKPRCFTVSGAQDFATSLSVNCTEAPSIVRLRAVGLHHLGDDNFSGSANSQLQLPSQGIEKSFNYNLPATPGVMPRLHIYARGIQYPATISFNGIQTATLGNSASSGDLSLYDFQLTGNANSIFHAGNNVLTIKTGNDNSSDWDDIEICGILLYYN